MQVPVIWNVFIICHLIDFFVIQCFRKYVLCQGESEFGMGGFGFGRHLYASSEKSGLGYSTLENTTVNRRATIYESTPKSQIGR